MRYDTVPLAKNARWLWAQRKTTENCYLEFHRTLTLDSLPEKAWIQLSAETSLRLWLNENLVYSGPPREAPPYFYFDTVDLLPRLSAGRNELRIVSHHQGVDSQSYQAGTPAILVAGQCTTGKEVLICFADTRGWKVRPITRYRPDAHRLSTCLGFSEHVDFEQPEAPWERVIELAQHPWSERTIALPRDFPDLKETPRAPFAITPHSEGLLVDFGMEVSGYVELCFQAGTPVTLRSSYAEALVRGNVCPGKSGMAYYDVLKLPASGVTWRSYEKRAFRYLHLNEPIRLIEAKVVEQNYPYVPQYLESVAYRHNKKSEEGRLLNQILDTSARTIALNSEDLLTDCPWRERAQYFDCYFYTEAMQKLFGTLEPIRRFLNQFSRGADETGLLRMCYPSPQGSTVIPDFSISYAIHLLRYLELSGDRTTVHHNLQFAERGVTAFAQYEDDNNLLVNVPGWIFIDNTFELQKFPRSAALNAIYHGGHRAVASLFRARGEESRAAEFDAHADRIRAAFRKTFLRDERVLDSDSTPDHEAFRYWNYHFSAESGRWDGKSFRLRTKFRIEDSTHLLRFAVHAGGRAWVDGKLVAQVQPGGSWARSAVFQPVDLTAPRDRLWHQLDVEVEWSNIDWECYLSCTGNVEWAPALVWEEEEFGACTSRGVPPPNAFESRLRRYSLPWMTQATVGHAAFHGLLEPDEARRLLSACLPTSYSFPFAKRATPFFARIDETPDQRRILPCNLPASMFYFCHALQRHGMGQAAKSLLLPIYRGMLDRGATTWWEEWNTQSSLCHAWSSFVVTFLEAN